MKDPAETIFTMKLECYLLYVCKEILLAKEPNDVVMMYLLDSEFRNVVLDLVSQVSQVWGIRRKVNLSGCLEQALLWLVEKNMSMLFDPKSSLALKSEVILKDVTKTVQDFLSLLGFDELASFTRSEEEQALALEFLRCPEADDYGHVSDADEDDEEVVVNQY